MAAKIDRLSRRLSAPLGGSARVIFRGPRIPVGSRLIEQMAHEEVHEFPLPIPPTRAMAASGHVQKIKILAGFNQPVDDLEGR